MDVLFKHIDKFWLLDGNDYNFIEYISLWRLILVKLLNDKLKFVDIQPNLTNIWKLFSFFSEFFGDFWIFNVIYFDFLPATVKKEQSEEFLMPKFISKEEILENFIENNFSNEEIQPNSDLEIILDRPTKSKKRKRKRDPSDVFDIPKRFRLCHQRDIVFIFHQTEATTVKTGQKLSAEKNGRTEFSTIFNRKPFSFYKRTFDKRNSNIRLDNNCIYDIRHLFL